MHVFVFLIVTYCYVTPDYFIFFLFCARALFDGLILSHLYIVRNSQYRTGFSFLFCAYILIYPHPHHYRLPFLCARAIFIQTLWTNKTIHDKLFYTDDIY